MITVPTAIDFVLPRLKIEEGFRPHVYEDTEGHKTIGYGFDVDAGITQRAAAGLLQAQVEEIHDALLLHQWYFDLDPVRQSACLDIAFNEGTVRFLNTWPNLIEALTNKQWEKAQQECHTRTTEDQARYDRLGITFLTGNP